MKRKLFNHKLTEDDHPVILESLASQTPIYVIAKKIGCDRHTLADYIRSHEELANAHQDREEAFKDSVEQELKRKILVEHNLNAIMFYADRKMRDRGYGEHIETENKNSLEEAIIIGEIPESEYPTESAEQPPPLPEPKLIPQEELPTNDQTKGMF